MTKQPAYSSSAQKCDQNDICTTWTHSESTWTTWTLLTTAFINILSISHPKFHMDYLDSLTTHFNNIL